MAKHTQTIRRQIADELFEFFDHFLKLALKGLRINKNEGEVDAVVNKNC